jgi:hypothetical protein
MPKKLVITDTKIYKKEHNNVRIKGRPMHSFTFTKTNNKEFTKEDVRKRLDKFVQDHREVNRNIKVMLSIDTDFGYRSAKAFNVNEEPIMVDEYEWESVPSFVIFFWDENMKPREGGGDENNDCLYEAITKISTKYYLLTKCKNPEDLKKQLRLERDDKISIDRMTQVGELMNVNIYISGDHSFIPTNNKTSRKNVHLTLINGHYEVNESYYKKCKYELLSGINYIKKRTLVVYEFRKDYVQCYNGITEYPITYEEYYKLRSLSFKGDEGFVRKETEVDSCEEKKKGVEKHMSLEEFYTFLLDESKILKELTKGMIDLSKSGYNFKNEALKIAHRCFKDFDEPDKITPYELLWLQNAMLGGLIFSKPGKYENSYDYDVRSAYPSIMSDSHFTFPIKKGEFSQIKEFKEEFINYGIYRCIIERSGDEDTDKLFRFNKTNYYSHFDINTARQLKLNIKLIIDSEANALLYTIKGHLYGNKVFLSLFQTLYELKDRSFFAKKIMNCVWGLLCSRKKIKKTDYKEINIDTDLVEPNEFRIIGERVHVTYTKKDDYYRFNYARIGVFLTSKVRHKMAMDMYKYREEIVHCHTDGFLSKVKILEITVGMRLGWEYKVKKDNLLVINPSVKVQSYV